MLANLPRATEVNLVPSKALAPIVALSPIVREVRLVFLNADAPIVALALMLTVVGFVPSKALAPMFTTLAGSVTVVTLSLPLKAFAAMSVTLNSTTTLWSAEPSFQFTSHSIVFTGATVAVLALNAEPAETTTSAFLTLFAATAPSNTRFLMV